MVKAMCMYTILFIRMRKPKITLVSSWFLKRVVVNCGRMTSEIKCRTCMLKQWLAMNFCTKHKKVGWECREKCHGVCVECILQHLARTVVLQCNTNEAKQTKGMRSAKQPKD